MSSRVKVHGTVAKGYEPIQKLFQKQLENGRGENAQVCVYVKGEKVADLWGSSVGNESYSGDSIQTIFSSTKTVTSVVFACLVDKGLLDYGEKVTTYWPEFGRTGRENMRVEDVLRHEAGLAKWTGKIKFEDLQTENIKTNAVGRVIESEPSRFPDEEYETVREYHGLTRGWILNEIFRRVEPSGRTIGEYLTEEIAKPLAIDVHIGAPDKGKRNHCLSCLSPASVILHMMLPSFISRKVEPSFGDIRMTLQYRKQFAQGDEVRRTAFPLEGLTEKDEQPAVLKNFLDSMPMRSGESPSANGACSARGLAKLGACIMNGGEIDGVRILSKDTCEKMQANIVTKKDFLMLGKKTSISQGGINFFK